MGNRLPTQASTVEVESKTYAHLLYCIGLFFVLILILFPFKNVFRPEFFCIVYFLLTSIFGILGFLVLPGIGGVLWYLGFIVLLILGIYFLFCGPSVRTIDRVCGPRGRKSPDCGQTTWIDSNIIDTQTPSTST